MQIRLIKVIGLRLCNNLFGGRILHLTKIRIRYGFNRGAQYTEKEEHIDQREQHHIDGEHYEIEMYGNSHKE